MLSCMIMFCYSREPCNNQGAMAEPQVMMMTAGTTQVSGPSFVEEGNTTHDLRKGLCKWQRNDSWLYGCFPKIVVPQNGWFIVENSIKMDDLGVPLFLETPTNNFPETNDQFSALSGFLNRKLLRKLVTDLDEPPPTTNVLFSPSNQFLLLGTLSISARLSFPLWLISLDAKLSDLRWNTHWCTKSFQVSMSLKSFFSFLLLLKFRSG